MADPNPPAGGLPAAAANAGACFPAKGINDPAHPCGKPAPPKAAAAAKPIVAPSITMLTPVVLVKKPYTSKPTRQLVTLGVDQAFDGTGTFTVKKGADKVTFFRLLKGGTEVPSGHIFPGKFLTSGVSLYAEGVKPSAAEKDITIELALTPGSAPVKPPVKTKLTSVEVTLDICKSRKARGVEPDLVADKIKTGRTVHVQTGFHHGRAMLIIRRAKPESFSGTLVLSEMKQKPADPNRVRAFARKYEIASAGQPVLHDPYEIKNTGIKAPGVKLWAEGAGISNAKLDAGFRLGVKGVDPDGDRVRMTVVQFSNLKAVVSPTEANKIRMGNGPVPLHNPLQGGLAAKDYDEGFAVNPPLVLVENSVIAGKRVALSVSIKPRVPVFWQVIRNLAPVPVGDHADIIKLSPNPVPTLGTLKADTLSNLLMADAVGSFHICPFVDCNDTQEFKPYDDKGKLIDREPFIVMNLVLIRAQGYKNTSKKGTLATQALGGAAAITAATGLQISSPEGIAGLPWTAAGAEAHNIAKFTVIGGGGNGKLGLDELFAGWVQNIPNLNIVKIYLDTSGVFPALHTESMIFAQNAPAVSGLGIFHQAGLVAPGAPMVGSTAAPIVLATPILDVSNFAGAGAGGNTCVGTETGAVGPPSLIKKADLPTAEHNLNVGQDWEVEQFDSPGLGASPAPLMYAGNLIGFHFNIDFRTHLCVWTNHAKVAGATADPACRLYSAVQLNTWTTRYAVSFNAAGVATVTVAPQIQVNVDTVPNRIAAAVEGSGLEVRFPVALNVYAVDART